MSEKLLQSPKKNPEDVIREASQNLIEVEKPQELYGKYQFKNKEELFEKDKNIFADTMYYFLIKGNSLSKLGEEVPLFRGYMLAQKEVAVAIMSSVLIVGSLLRSRITGKTQYVLNAKENSTLIAMGM